MISFWRADGTIHFGKRYGSFKIYHLVVEDPYFQRIKYVIQKYRENIDDGPSDYPTPSEFLRSDKNLI